MLIQLNQRSDYAFYFVVIIEILRDARKGFLDIPEWYIMNFWKYGIVIMVSKNSNSDTANRFSIDCPALSFIVVDYLQMLSRSIWSTESRLGIESSHN